MTIFEHEEEKKYTHTRAKRKALKVTFQGEPPICFKKATDTFIEALRRIPEEKYQLIEIEVNRIKLISQELDEKHPEWQKPLKLGWFVMCESDTETKYRLLTAIKKLLNLEMTVELGYDFEYTSAGNIGGKGTSRVRNAVKLLVKMPDGSFIGEPNPIDTYIQTLWAIGIDELKKKKLTIAGFNLISQRQEYKNQVQVGINLWATCPNSTKDKVKWLRVISAFMKIKMEITML